MRFWLLSFAAAALFAPDARPQLIATSTCDAQNCTTTVEFGTSEPDPPISGAPYSGQLIFENIRTLPNGAHTTTQSLSPMTYRDSKGRVRTERLISPARPGMRSADAFNLAEIEDCLAGNRYILDPVNRVAHRLRLQCAPIEKWRPANVATAPMTRTNSDGTTDTSESLPTRDVSGVPAVGKRDTHAIPADPTAANKNPVAYVTEMWTDPRTGVVLLLKNTGPNLDTTQTMHDYKAAEPDPALFKIPPDYRVADETGSFRFVRARLAPANAVSVSNGVKVSVPSEPPAVFTGPQGTISGPQVPGSVTCFTQSCMLTFNLASGQLAIVTAQAPYSGRQILEMGPRTLADGRQFPGASYFGTTTYRDIKGRVRTERFVAPAATLVEIQDPVAGYSYILDPVNRVAHRVLLRARPATFDPPLPLGRWTSPDGATSSRESLGTKMVAGVAAIGLRMTGPGPAGVTVSETWTDPQTGIVLIQKNSGANVAGVKIDSTLSIADYKAGEPDPAEFQIPAGYKVVDEAGMFRFSIPRGN